MHFVCSRERIDLVWLCCKPWNITVHVSLVHLTIIVKLVSIMLNSVSNTNEFQELCSGRGWKKYSFGMCGTHVF